MSDKKCILCGKTIDEDELICLDCSESTTKRELLNLDYNFNDSETLDTKQGDSLEAEDDDEIIEGEILIEPLEKKTKKGKTTFLITAIILTLAIAGGAFFWYSKQMEIKEKHEEEVTFWNTCIESNTPDMYSLYLTKYPTGTFQSEAMNKIAELRQIEADAWQKLKTSSDLNDYYSFLSAYPKTPFINQIRHTMDSLNWISAQKDNTADSYKAYIENIELGNISGYYKDVAQKRYDYLSTTKVIGGKEREEIQSVISTFFEALSNNQLKKLDELLEKNVINFYGVRNRSSATIIKTIKSDIERNKVKKLTYTIQSDSLKILKDAQNIYNTNVVVKKKITYLDKKKANDDSEEVLHVELTPEKKVRSLFVYTKDYLSTVLQDE